MRRLCTSLMLLLPLFAADAVMAAPLQDAAAAGNSPWMVSDSATRSVPSTAAGGLGFSGLGLGARSGGSVDYLFNRQWRAHVRVDQQSWQGIGSTGGCLASNPAIRRDGCDGDGLVPRLTYSEIGATFAGDGYSLDMNVSSSQPTPRSPLLPRVLPQSSTLATTVNGLPFGALRDGTSVQARGRVALGEESGLDFGASLGRIRLLPNNLLGIHMLGQKSLSLGLDSGPVSGRIVGHLIQPESGTASSLLGPDHRWTSVDLGVTWRLPWQGSLSFGAHNVWSSGEAPKPKQGPKPDQSSIPYVQYHQDF